MKNEKTGNTMYNMAALNEMHSIIKKSIGPFIVSFLLLFIIIFLFYSTYSGMKKTIFNEQEISTEEYDELIKICNNESNKQLIKGYMTDGLISQGEFGKIKAEIAFIKDNQGRERLNNELFKNKIE